MISIQHADFNHGDEYQALKDEANGDGAIVTFTGVVRDFNALGAVSYIHIEHYPEMVEKSLMQICATAKTRWQLGQIRVIHRVGRLNVEEQIVFVGVTSQHRNCAFEACQFIMDYLKTSAPLWKQECTSKGMQWVARKQSDEQAMQRWKSDYLPSKKLDSTD